MSAQDCSYSKDDQDQPDPTTPGQNYGNSRGMLSTSKLDPKPGNVSGLAPPKLPMCNNETLLEFAISLRNEKVRHRAKSPLKPRGNVVHRGPQHGAIVVSGPPTLRPTAFANNSLPANKCHRPIAAKQPQNYLSAMSDKLPPVSNRPPLPLRAVGYEGVTYRNSDPISSTSMPGQPPLSQNVASQPQRKPAADNLPIFFDSAEIPNFGYLAPEYTAGFRDPSLGNQDYRYTSFNDLYHHEIGSYFKNSWPLLYVRLNDLHKKGPTQRIEAAVKGFNSAQWDQVKRGIVEKILFLKFWCCNASFYREDDILVKLLDTGDRLLIYAVKNDRSLGIGRKISHAKADGTLGQSEWGENTLGEALMATRRKSRELIGPDSAARSVLDNPRDRAYAYAMKEGYLRWKNDGKLEVVAEKCRDYDHRELINELARMANNSLDVTQLTALGTAVYRIEGRPRPQPQPKV